MSESTGSPSQEQAGNSQTSPPSTTHDPPDYIESAIEYAHEALRDRKGERFNVDVRRAARRFFYDLRRASRENHPFVFSALHATDACAFIEKLPHVEGKWEFRTIKLVPAQCFFIVQLFGFRRHDGARRFSSALWSVARKNAKSSLAAAILLYVLCRENEMGPQILAAATTGDQAKIVWGIARRMVEATPGMAERFDLEVFQRSIVRHEMGGSFRPINAKASTQDGLNPSALCFDELHAHKTRDLYDVLRSAAGSRRNPLFLYTTTEGYENAGPWSEVREFAKQILNRILEADHFLCVMYGLDDADDDFDESKWGKANPLLGISVSVDKMREYANEAKQQPGSLSEFRIKRLNRQASVAEGFIDLLKWRRCSLPVILEQLRGAPCYGGLDLASTRDMCAWRMLWHHEGKWWTWGRYWVPENAVASRTERGTVPYKAWVENGYLTQTPGDVTDYDLIRKQIIADFEQYEPRRIGFDPWNATQLALELTQIGVPMEKFIQGTRSFTGAMSALERAYISGNLCHGGDPILQWNAANMVVRYDVNRNRAPDRKKSADKIDGLVALLMAFGLAEADETEYMAQALADPVRLNRGKRT